VSTDFKQAQANIAIAKKAQELADRAHAEHDLRKVAKELGATMKTSELVGHTSQVPEIGSMSGQAGSEAFKLKQGEISGPLSLGRNYAVMELTERQEPAMGDEFAKTKDSIREQLIGTKGQQAWQLFVDNCRTRLSNEGKVKLNMTEVDMLLGGKRRS